MASILIPAYNEEAVIARTLRSVLASVGEADHEIVVVCNACRDKTADVARSVSQRIQVIETAEPGKCNALNLGERLLKTFPRIYLDADIEVSQNLVAELCQALSDPAARGAWSGVRYDVEQSSWMVRAFYRVWTAMPYNRPGRIGVGVYAMNAAGRARFEQFPNIISDDGFVRGQFPEHSERAIVDACYTIVRAPRDVHSLIAIKTRSRMGVMQLRQFYPDLLRAHSDETEHKTRSKLPPWQLWHLFPVYAAVVLYTKRQATRRLRANQSAWDRDLSARDSE